MSYSNVRHLLHWLGGFGAPLKIAWILSFHSMLVLLWLITLSSYTALTILSVVRRI